MFIRSSLTNAIVQFCAAAGCENSGIGTIGLLIIDQQGEFDTINPELISRQEEFLMIALRNGVQPFMIELSQYNRIPHSKTILRFRSMMSVDTPVIRKNKSNAFEQTTLASSLFRNNVKKYLIILGHEANDCVKETVLGGRYKPGDRFYRGAVGRGYTVLTCQQILSGRDADWARDPNPHIWFYESL